jgi:hypothetical protein
VTSAGDLELERQIRSDAGEIRDGVGPFTLALDSPLLLLQHSVVF